MRGCKRLQVQADLVAAAENTSHVFERFWQVSHGLIRAIGGDVEVESELGRGSVFTL
ncbi:hypothetical protein BH23GEM5_BH23GEM5_23380 [soil metagenome]